MALVVNFFGGPGIGKSTIAAEVYAGLSKMNINCELVKEYAKDKVWEESHFVLENQLYVFAKQHHNLFRLNNKVDVIINDSPILLSIIYSKVKSDNTFYKLILEEFNKFKNVNYLLKRRDSFNSSGRIHDYKESVDIDEKIKAILKGNNIPFIDGNKEELNKKVIINDIINNEHNE